MILTIHRGAHEVGGSCVELKAGGHRLILDLGLPLVNRDGTRFEFRPDARSADDLVSDGVLPPVAGLYDDTATDIAGVIVTHAHPDHYGLIGYVHPSIPIYMTAGTQALIEVSRIFLPRPVRIDEPEFLWSKCQTPIGPFRIESVLVDHSAPDALALVVEADGRRVFYSGDLRAHGRKAVLFEKLVREPPPDIDCILLEGTTIGRQRKEPESEDAVEHQFKEILSRKTNIALVVCSSQNLDRLVSIYKAAKRAGCILVIDLYTAFVLDALQCVSDRIPQYNLAPVRVKYWYNQAVKLAKADLVDFLYKVNTYKIGIDEIVDKRRQVLMLVKDNELFRRVTDKLPDRDGIEFIWSLWEGYLDGAGPVERFCGENGITLRKIHASGHASVEDLQRLAKAVKPKRIVPIHTFHADQYPTLFESVTLLADHEEMEI